MPRIIIINYGMGNIRNVQRGLQHAGADAIVSSQPTDLENADAVVLPGVGAFRDAIKNLAPFNKQLLERINAGIPVIGICLGLQLLFTQSTEDGLHQGLDVFQGQILRLPKNQKVPQMGWNTLKFVHSDNPLIQGIADHSYVYFVHSYYANPDHVKDIVAVTHYGVDIPAIVTRGTVFATQFHPEKSGQTGQKMLQNFVKFVKK
jgi:glutamine amidotransferase